MEQHKESQEQHMQDQAWQEADLAAPSGPVPSARFDTAKRTARYFCVGFNPLDGKWLPVVERSEVTR
jgi:hypothetical protein